MLPSHVPCSRLGDKGHREAGLRDHAEGGGYGGTGSVVVAKKRRRILVETAFGTKRERERNRRSTCCHLHRISRRRRECCWYGNSTWRRNKHSGRHIWHCMNLYVIERKRNCFQNTETRYSRLGKMSSYYQENIHCSTIKVTRNLLEYMSTRRTRYTFQQQQIRPSILRIDFTQESLQYANALFAHWIRQPYHTNTFH